MSLQTPQIENLLKLNVGTYFVLGKDLLYVRDVIPHDQLFIVEDCKTLETRFLFWDMLDDLDIREVNVS